MVAETDEGLFQRFVEAEVQQHRERCREAWDSRIRAGLTPREIVGLDPWPRPPEWTLSDDVIARAKTVVAELHSRGIRLDAIAEDKLNRVAARTWTSVPAGVEETIAQAESAVRQYDAQKASAAKGLSTKGRILVRHSIGGYSGNLVKLQEYSVSAEELRAVLKIVEKHRADAELHGYDTPVGFTPDTWPPLEILVEPAGMEEEEPEPQPAGPFIVR